MRHAIVRSLTLTARGASPGLLHDRGHRLEGRLGARELGFDGVVSIEHEDRDWGSPSGPPERRREGLREAQRVLRAALPGTTP